MRVIIDGTTVTPPRYPVHLNHYRSEDHDEGYHYERFSVTEHEDGEVHLHRASGGTDCDGRHESSRSFTWSPETQQWIYDSGEEYDQFAQAAGY